MVANMYSSLVIIAFLSPFLLLNNVACLRVCETFQDYALPRGRCWENPDSDLETPDIIKRHGYPVRTYTVTTEDGYILTVFRIPSNNTPVALTHGITLSSVDFVHSANNSLAFVLANAGYDVWLFNLRGSRYSLGHRHLDYRSYGFWNFSFHEMGAYDLPAMLTLVAEETGQAGNILYIGYSMGTTSAFVYSITHPEQSSALLKAMICFAPVAYVGNPQNPVYRYGPALWPLVNASLFYPLNGALFRRTPQFVTIYRMLYTLYPLSTMALSIFLNGLLFGFDIAQVSPVEYPVQSFQGIEAASFKTVSHYIQILERDLFELYDYGPTENLQRYGQSQVPKYNVSRMNVPFVFIYGPNDEIAPPKKVRRFYEELPEKVRYGIWAPDYENFTHTDFLMAKDVVPLLYTRVLSLISSLIT